MVSSHGSQDENSNHEFDLTVLNVEDADVTTDMNETDDLLDRETTLVMPPGHNDFIRWNAINKVTVGDYFATMPLTFGNAFEKSPLLIEDMAIDVIEKVRYTDSVDLMLFKGVPLFNAMLMKTMPVQEFDRIKINIVPEKFRNTLADIMKSFGIIVMTLIIRAQMPNWTKGDLKNSKMIARFVERQFDVTHEARHYVNMIISFDIHKLGFDWMLKLDMNKADQVFKNRILVGMAGYRLLRFCIQTEPLRNKEVQLHLKELYKQGLSWDMHPLTKSKQFIMRYGSFGMELANFMNSSYDIKDLEDAVSNKKIYDIPKSEESRVTWKNWTKDNVLKLENLLFKE